jgi:hypothetical protein
VNQINDTRMLEMMRGTPPPTWEQTCLDLDKKLADSRQYVTELENRLRALWDKLEGERKHYMERIEKLEEAGDAMAERCEVDIENWYRTKKGEP